jgi:chromate reductase
MTTRRKILAISGSTKKDSTNLQLIHAIADLTTDFFDISIYKGLSTLPHFNPDLDTENPPTEVSDFRNQLKNSDGILICTPEYAMGVPGTLKNAIDWTVSSAEFSHKPVALITASSQGQKAHASLIETLKIIEAEIPEELRLLISFAKTKIKDNKIIDVGTLEKVNSLLQSFKKLIEEKIDQA